MHPLGVAVLLAFLVANGRDEQAPRAPDFTPLLLLQRRLRQDVLEHSSVATKATASTSGATPLGISMSSSAGCLARFGRGASTSLCGLFGDLGGSTAVAVELCLGSLLGAPGGESREDPENDPEASPDEAFDPGAPAAGCGEGCAGCSCPRELR